MSDGTGSFTDRAGGENALRALSAGGLARLGLGAIAYIRPVTVDGQPVFAVHAADGTPIAIAARLTLAQSVALQNDLQPLSVH